jgi:purine-binding chemotaxis protein CheW
MDMADALEVVELTTLTAVPYVPPFVKGAMNLRGQIITVVDIGYFLTNSVSTIRHDTRILIVDINGHRVGVAIDTVLGTFNVNTDEIQPPLVTLKEEVARFIKGQVKVNDHICVLLDIKSLLTHPAMMKLTSDS